ncbi:MAG: excinuclease ABC subunit UvrB [Bacteroidetes bacterium]|nr:MAG: excinuclease ABC subunit UvrB [Bacteroidota bacterium]MBL1145107.1 excinuclease ABC subunit UvrB [Bacteroidota bacterium]NOG57904.1 excinuclease ABC subunit UvrB [Bacteroidota bacterium]
MDFKLVSDYKPTGDQPQAIKQLVDGLNDGVVAQTLLGVTGSGKTFTIANVIQETGRPTLVLSHNKTLAAQLYGEFKQFFPDNAVEYFVSYYDYYQPEAYMPGSDTYIEKDLGINDEIEKLRLSATSALLSGRRDVIVVSSVSCIYGISNPLDFKENITKISKFQKISRNKLLHQFVSALYARTMGEFKRGTFRVKGDTVDLYPAYADIAYRISFFGDEIEDIRSFDPLNGNTIERFDNLNIYPANIFVTTQDRMNEAVWEIQQDMVKQVEYFKEIGKPLEAKRLEERTLYDLEMMKELGYCSGIENYSRYFDARQPGTRPFCLIDYFPDDYLLVVDESHVTVSQVNAMYGGDRARKINLVEYGFRLPAAMDNRPLKFDEWESLRNQAIYVSATPADYELRESEGIVVEQVIRPTGLLDPVIEIRPTQNQIDDLMEEIALRTDKNERILVTTLTKRMAEELTKYFIKNAIKTRYIHSDVDTLERVEILRDLRLGTFDVLVGVNLLREGLDLPEVSLVAVMDADKEGFLRSHRSLTQTAGRAARNVNGLVIFYADKITGSMQKTMDETDRRREIQIAYNTKHGIKPQALIKKHDSILKQTKVADGSNAPRKYELDQEQTSIAAERNNKYLKKDEVEKAILRTRKEMEQAAKELDFIEAARLRDEMFELEKLRK